MWYALVPTIVIVCGMLIFSLVNWCVGNSDLAGFCVFLAAMFCIVGGILTVTVHDIAIGAERLNTIKAERERRTNECSKLCGLTVPIACSTVKHDLKHLHGRTYAICYMGDPTDWTVWTEFGDAPEDER